MVMVIVVRFAQDISEDPTTHNLVLLEVGIAILIGGASSGAGVFLANLLRSNKTGNEDQRSKAEIENTKREIKEPGKEQQNNTNIDNK